jgi:hypothetical protein
MYQLLRGINLNFWLKAVSLAHTLGYGVLYPVIELVCKTGKQGSTPWRASSFLRKHDKSTGVLA